MTRLLGLLAIVAMVVLSQSASTQAQNKEKDKDKFVISKDAQQIIDLTNQARKKMNLEPLKPNPLLFKCAQGHSENMAKQMKAGHDLDGKNPADRVDASGYYYKTCGENVGTIPYNVKPPIAKNQLIPTLFNGWMNSPIHKREILRAEYQEIGIGIAQDKNGSYYYTEVFGTEAKKN